jgi:hypothetical protein
VHLMGVGHFSIRLLDLLHNVDDLTQDSVESCEGIIRWFVRSRLSLSSPGTGGSSTLDNTRDAHPAHREETPAMELMATWPAHLGRASLTKRIVVARRGQQAIRLAVSDYATEQ